MRLGEARRRALAPPGLPGPGPRSVTAGGRAEHLLLGHLPGLVAAAGWAVVNQASTGRKLLGIAAVFFGSSAALIFLAQFGPIGLVLAMGVSGGFGVAARRLLDPLPDA